MEAFGALDGSSNLPPATISFGISGALETPSSEAQGEEDNHQREYHREHTQIDRFTPLPVVADGDHQRVEGGPLGDIGSGARLVFLWLAWAMTCRWS